MKNFPTLNSAIEFYKLARELAVPSHLKDQFLRAASSVALNLAEGRGRTTIPDQKRFFTIALGSIRECQAVLMLADLKDSQAWKLLDSVAAQGYRLMKNAGGS